MSKEPKVYKIPQKLNSFAEFGSLLVFGKKGQDRLRAGACPRCGTSPIHLEEFRDEKSRREWGITALCQACQDVLFASPQE